MILKTSRRPDPKIRLSAQGLGRRSRRCAFRFSAALGVCIAAAATLTAHGRDILRPGSGGVPTPHAVSTGGSSNAVAAQARANALDAMARTSRAIQSVQAMQAAARAAAVAGRNNLGVNPNNPLQQLPNVPNGLVPGGLEVATGATVGSKLWQGANLPTQTASGGSTTVNIKQTSQQAILNWKSFNIGKQTTLNFDQSAGGANRSQWVAFNKVSDPSGVPSQILGSIKADGQVYVINQNGIIFGGSSQVNARALVASSLPINDNLIQLGLLNNRDAQFLFSSVPVPGGSDGTPGFTPDPPPGGKIGDVVVKAGAQLTSTQTGDGDGGRVMLVGPNVRNEGTISTPAGQTILAAGNQVAIAAHASNDPSLRGLDVWVGKVADGAGTSTNTGIISAPTGNVTMTGRRVEQSGAVESTTTVNLNGRIDLNASYGAVANPNYDNQGTAGFGGPQFLNQNTGTVSFGEGSATQVLPDYASSKSVPGTTLPQNSQVNVEGLSIHLGSNAVILAPSGDVAMRAGAWPYVDAGGNGTTLAADGTEEAGLTQYFSGSVQRFFLSGGQVYLDTGSLINVAGSTEVFVPLSQSILEVQFRGSEFADSPLQRTGSIRGVDLTIDVRRSGVTNGRYWLGTPLGDATGLVGIIERNVAQLTVNGGTVDIQSGGSAVVRSGATIDVSGGYYRYEGGMVQTTRLLRGGNLIDISKADPGQVYDGVYTGTFTVNHSRWGVTRTFATPWMTGRHYQAGYIGGGDGGILSLSAAGMAVDGLLLGRTIDQPRGVAVQPELGSLSLFFAAQRKFDTGASTFEIITESPTPPAITFGGQALPSVGRFTQSGDTPAALPAARLSSVVLSPSLLSDGGFGHLAVENYEGSILVPSGVALTTAPFGSVSLTGANVNIQGTIVSPGGSLSLKAYAFSPSSAALFPLENVSGALVPVPDGTRGFVTLGSGASLSTRGLVTDDRIGSAAAFTQAIVLDGGSVAINSYGANLASGSAIDVSSGLVIGRRGAVTYGNAGSIEIRTGRDPGLANVVGGPLTLGSALAGVAGVGKTGGTLAIQASRIQIGGSATSAGALVLAGDFFSHGGFTSYTLDAIGAPSSAVPAPGDPETYEPAILIAPGTSIRAVAENLALLPVAQRTQGLRFGAVLRDEGVRTPVGISFSASGADDPFTTDVLEVRGDIIVGAGASIRADAGAKISFKGQTVTMHGSVLAPGGKITIAGAGSFPVAPDDALSAAVALPTVVIGAGSVLSTAGTTVLTPDAYGRRVGTVHSGGTISVSGNIVASAGVLLDVSGASSTLDTHPATLGNVGAAKVPLNSGVTSPLWKLRRTPVTVQSSGGTIDLQGSQMLFTDATLLGRAGGPTATGGTLSIFSGKFHQANTAQHSAETNLLVTQGGLTIAPSNTNPRVGVAVLGGTGTPLTGQGYFAADRFAAGGFDSLDLGAKFVNANPLSFGGNVEFRGPVSVTARGNLRVAAGGVIQADAAVSLTGRYVALGQIFTAPLHPDDQPQLFTQSPANPEIIHTFAPTGGTGSLTVRAELIDIGSLSLQGIGSAAFTAENGDIRGNGILSAAGDLRFRAGQIYPPTASTFDIFAYDDGSRPGTVTIAGSSARSTPYSAGGTLRIFASKIVQGGTLRAPFGTIQLGWDGTDLDPSTSALDTPVNAIAGTTIAPPVTTQVTLQAGSTTSVAAWTGTAGSQMLIPFGLSTDGNSWIDPRGVNVTITGLPEKRITVSGTSVVAEAGSILDLRGGGDLYAYRWTAGNGGSADILGTASGEWSSASEYQSGDLVTYGGKTWTARVRSGDAATGAQTPVAGRYWSQVAESFAILPGYAAQYAPYAPNNTGPNAQQLGGDPGYVSDALKIGDQVYLEGIPGLAPGTYTLLPRRFALLPGAFLVTAKGGTAYGTIAVPDGSYLVSGYRVNALNQAQTVQTLRSRFEVASASVVGSRASYDEYRGDSFISAAADRLNLASVQRLPTDSGSLAILAGTALRMEGSVLTAPQGAGRGSSVDIRSTADIEIIGGTGVASGGTGAVLNSAAVTAWGAESLLIGGRRYRVGDEIRVDVGTANITLNNPGGTLAADDIALVAKTRTTIAAGSSIAANGADTLKVDSLTVPGDGTLVRVSSAAGAAFTRTNTTASTAPLLSVGAGARIAGRSITLDSSYGSAIDPAALLESGSLDFGSGQISIMLGGTGALTGSVVPQHLTLSGALLEEVQHVESLTLRSYRTIDVYGSGTFGGSLGRLTLFAAGMRGYDQGSGTAQFDTGSIALGNPSNAAALPAPGASSGTLRFDSDTFQLGVNAFSTAGWQNVAINASAGVLGTGTGSFSTPANLTVSTPLITGARGSSQTVTAGGNVVLLPLSGTPSVAGGLGAGFTFTGRSVSAGTDIVLPSGQITLHATGAAQPVTVGARLDVGGLAQEFYDVTRYPDAGTITLTSDFGDVNLLSSSTVSVAGALGGGKAGLVTVGASQGAFSVGGAALLGTASGGGTTGSFRLDARTLPSFEALATALNGGGFFEERSFRIRTGDVTVTNPLGLANVARAFSLTADTGGITVQGTIDAHGATGGKISLSAGGSVELQAGSVLTVHAQDFSSAGKGGEISIEAGAAINGVASTTARVTMSTDPMNVLPRPKLDLGVDTYVPGDITTPGSSAFAGKFTGTLHLRAPRVGNDVQVDALLGDITGASSVIVEGYRLYSASLLNNALRTTINTEAANYMNAGYATMFTRLTTGSPNAAALGSALVIAPGVEIYSAAGDLTLGTAVSGLNSEDWDLSTFRYGPKLAPGILTLRAKGDIVFNNTLSDSFTPVVASINNGNSTMWLAPLATVVTANGLPVNAQSWSYRITAGADLSSADFRAVLPAASLASGKGSVLVGEFYPAIPNSTSTGASPGIGSNGTTENTIQITTGAANRTRFEVIRTGTGDIAITAGRDVQLRNQFATIYTAGIRIPDATRVFAQGDFVLPIVEKSTAAHPNQGDLGTPQQNYPAQWAISGGSVAVSAQQDIGRFTLLGSDVVPDSSKQLPNNWLYRRGYVNPSTGLFGEGGVGISGQNNAGNVSDASASTAWWIDYSNFFEGIGALGGGNVSLIAGSDIINADAVIPTNARMPGVDPISGLNIAPDASKLLQFGGGDLLVKAGANIDGGIFYVEKGSGTLSAGGQITTNYTRSPSLVYLGSSLQPPSIIQSVTPDVYDPATWLPTTLFVGDSHFDVSARGDVLLGPVTNTFLLPQGANNKFWYKTYFNTFSADAGASVASFGGSVTHRLSVTMPGQTTPQSVLLAWLDSQNLFNGVGAASRSSNRQPWIRLAETSTGFFATQTEVSAPNLISTAFAGDINIVGATTLFPSSTGTIELAASDSILGLQVSGKSRLNSLDVTVWTSASLNLSDADPASLPGIASPVAYANYAGRTLNDLRSSRLDPFVTVDPSYEETGAWQGASIVTQQALHAAGLLHAGDTSPVRLYAGGGDVTGLTLFSPKAAEIVAANDITDVALYLQNIRSGDISIVSAGRDIIPNNPNAATRSLANNAVLGNLVGDQSFATVSGSSSNALPGDIQINGPGTLEVLAGRNIDLGTEANVVDGTGLGITSIGNSRNPFLATEGADVIVFAGLGGAGGTGPALGLSGSALQLAPFIQSFGSDPTFQSAYLQRLGVSSLDGLTDEQKSIVGLEIFFRRLRTAGRDYTTTGTYDAGVNAVATLLAKNTASGSLFTRTRDIRTSTNGSITIGTVGGGVTMASDIFGNPLTPPGIVTEYGGGVSIFTDQSVNIGQARIFTLRGGDIVIWSTNGDIAAGTAPKTVVTAPPTRVTIDVTSADVKTDLGGLATGGGIGVLAAVAGVKAGDVDLIAPKGVVDAGDAGIRSTGNLNIAATTVLNASNIQVGGSTSGVSSGPTVAAPNVAGLTNAGNTTASTASAVADATRPESRPDQTIPKEEPNSDFTIEVLGYGGGED